MGNTVENKLVFHDSPPPPTSSSHLSSPPEAHSAASSNTTKDHRSDCEVVDQLKKENVVVIMRTGATESYTKLPVQLLTTLRCFKKDEILLYSDLADTMAQFEIEDILAKVPEATRLSNPDFDVYQKLHAFKATNQELSTFPLEWSDEEHTTAWTLDKYKFMHMLEDTYYSRPEGKWYVFIETDTYMIWSNLVRYLRSLDPSGPLYLGSAAQVLGQPFAHGGSGFILTRPALEKIFKDKERGWASRWDEMMIEECCGDFVAGLALAQAGVELHNIWPMINGEYPDTLPFGPGHWCQSIITMHHIPPAEVSNVWRYEQERGYDAPMQIKDLYFKFIEPQLKSFNVVQSWDNLADDVIYRASGATEDWRQPKGWLSETEKEAHKSGENCELVCKSQKDCFQWLWKSGNSGEKTLEEVLKQREGQKASENGDVVRDAMNGTVKTRQEEDPDLGPTCCLSKSFKLGKYARGKENQYAGPGAELWVSGWDMETIDKWVERNQCEPQWVLF